jgi:FkbH-like protein
LNKKELINKKVFKIAILSSFTINGIKETLQVKCAKLDLYTKFYIGEYNQYAQEIFDSDSGLYEFNPDLVIIFIDAIALTGDKYFLPYTMSIDERKVWKKDKIDELISLAQTITEHSKAKVILHNLEKPFYSSLGIIENKQEIGFIESIEMINIALRNHFKESRQVYVFDYDAFCSEFGKRNVLDYKLYYLGDIKLNPQFFPHLCNRYIGYVRSLSSLTKKCIVLDLDNTLWGGVVGEAGLEGILLGPTPEGRPFLEFQKHLLSLFRRGVILAINSRNNAEDALAVLRHHPHMILKEKHFAAMRMNWDDKVANMKSLAEEINIGLDSLVFFDDDHMNREMISEFLPDVTVVDLPNDSALYVKTLMDLNYFHSMSITEEDKKKGRMYSEEKKRREVAQSTTDLTEYLRRLDVTVSIEEAKSLTIPRISQLTQKTNQFNMTTRRYTEEAITQYAESDKYRVVSIHVSDKFGNNGLTGVAIVEKGDKGAWRIDTFLLSCRIIGRRVEETLLAYVINEAKKEGANLLYGEFITSRKNKPAKDFYNRNGFTAVHGGEPMELWEYDLSNDYQFPDFIDVKIK